MLQPSHMQHMTSTTEYVERYFVLFYVLQAKRDVTREKQATTYLTESQDSTLLQERPTALHYCIFHYRMNFKRYNLWKF
jgi:hypothetical protein